MKRPVVWSARARRDLRAIADYINQENPAASRRVVKRIGHSAELLGQFATGRAGRVPGSYEKPVPGLPYVLIYKITSAPGQGEVVNIAYVIHMARNWPEGVPP